MNTYRWAISLLLCFALFHVAWGGCGVPPQLDYAAPSDDALDQNIFLPGTNLIYNCRPGYVRIPRSRTLTCQDDHTWSTPSEPFCTRRSCGNPGDIENGEMHAEDFRFGSRVTYTCNEGYQMISRRAYRDCQVDGSWSNAPPECEVDHRDHRTAENTSRGTSIHCPDPDVPNSRRLSGFTGPYRLNSEITLECNKGFDMTGSNRIICNSDSEWVPEIPKCKSSICHNIWELQEEARTCTSTPEEWIKYLQVQYLSLQIENLKLDIEIKKKRLGA